ncbi:hypothetical protein [Capnocytophaga sp. G2]|uniref:hypothetical protein n=1 Tax=Capnocytophaga sp. G2 TaxID=3110695 RepID=UPI002B467ED6|nr:hypothetical protein [Capnocytophaga sp. G2]MEB3005919.1 hypothetical protein [Capnocytophaga sp. G2]
MKKYKLKETKKNVTEFDAGLNLYAYKEENQNYLFFNNKIYPLRYTPMIFKKIDKVLYIKYSDGYCEKLVEDKFLPINNMKNIKYINFGKPYSVIFIYGDEYKKFFNLLDLETNKLLLKKDSLHWLYIEKDIIVTYDILGSFISRINTDTETLWQFTIASLGDSPYPDEEDRIDKIVGIANGNLWVYTKLYRLIALDIETGCVQYHTDCFGVQLDEVTENIFAIASNGWTVIDTQTFTIKEDYFFSKEAPEGMGQYESVYKPLLQGDYFTFIGSKHKEYGGIGWIGIFDYKARKLVWEYELITQEERNTSRNQLVPSQPLYISGNKLYIKDVKDNLYIFEREE